MRTAVRKLVAVSPYKIVLHAKVISMKKFEDDVKCLVDECEKILGDIFDLKMVKGKVKGKTTPSYVPIVPKVPLI